MKKKEEKKPKRTSEAINSNFKKRQISCIKDKLKQKQIYNFFNSFIFVIFSLAKSIVFNASITTSRFYFPSFLLHRLLWHFSIIIWYFVVFRFTAKLKRYERQTHNRNNKSNTNCQKVLKSMKRRNEMKK